MKNRILFWLTVLTLKLLVKGDFELKSQDNDNNSVTMDLCSLQPEKGSCDQKITRYYYNSAFKSCTSFTYTGCKDNPNSFKSREECKKNCPGRFIHTRQPLHCFDEPEKGLCEKYIPSFYYDWKTNNCEKFIYGGCLGNKNRFSSIDNCINECRTFEFSIKMEV